VRILFRHLHIKSLSLARVAGQQLHIAQRIERVWIGGPQRLIAPQRSHGIVQMAAEGCRVGPLVQGRHLGGIEIQRFAESRLRRAIIAAGKREIAKLQPYLRIRRLGRGHRR